MSTLTHYFEIIRKTTVAFSTLFNNIVLIRYNKDGSEDQRFIVPIEWADKEKFVKRLQGDPDLSKKIQINLPRMSYSLNGMQYDASRKLNTNNMNYAQYGDTTLSQYNPVPYDFDFGLTIYTRSIEDGNQILEQIIPYFTNDYFLRVNLIPQMGIVKNLPVILNTIQPTIDSEGLFNSEVRTVIWNLGFTVKGFIFGAIKEAPVITSVDVNVLESTITDNTLSDSPCCQQNPDTGFQVLPNGHGDYIKDEFVYQGKSYNMAFATGKVLEWNSTANTILISQVCGNFKPNQPIVGVKSLAIHVANTQIDQPKLHINFHTIPEPPTANANTYFTANTTVTYY